MARVTEQARKRNMEVVFLRVQHSPNGIRTSELVQATGFERRTIDNYLDEMRQEGKVHKESVLWFPSKFEEIQSLKLDVTPEEAYIYYLGSRLLVKQHDKRNELAQVALIKLADALYAERLVGDEIMQAARELAQRPSDPRYGRTFETVVRGYLRRKQLQLTYRLLNGYQFETFFEPYLLEPSAIGRATYVIGYSSQPNALRAYKLERIIGAQLTRESFRVPADFPGLDLLRNSWSIILGEQTVRVLLRFSPSVRARVLETQWHPSQQHTDDRDKQGWLRWQVDVADTLDMQPWIRGWGSDVEVIEPEELRMSLTRHVALQAQMYGVAALPERPQAAIAHTVNDYGRRHDLVEHLHAVADLSEGFARSFGGGQLARYLGLWHDIGKFNPAFQQYLLDAERDPKRKRHGPDHKAAGACVAEAQKHGFLNQLIQGHHGGMKAPADFESWYEDKKAATHEAMALARKAVPEAFQVESPSAPTHVGQDPLAAEFFLRMLFSALVDADFLDTEEHFNPDKTAARTSEPSMDVLWQRFEQSQSLLLESAKPTHVNQMRREIYRACIDAAQHKRGLFRLTVPTGGGKTLSGLSFALRHALKHNLKRVLVVVPFITITEQTAGVYRGILENEGDPAPVVLEHHSGAVEQMRGNSTDSVGADKWNRLAAENWDAPVVVTTTVQFFESLFANGTSRCRKLHRLAESVIVIDEAQALPIGLLDPILDGLRELCTHYGSSVVLSTATQPAFQEIEPFRKLDAAEIVPQPERYFSALSRVDYEWRMDEEQSWEEVANWMRVEPRVLAICNTKKDALALLSTLDDSEALHLSTLLCGAHRRRVVSEVKRRLDAQEPCRLVTTQVVEAGVDIDFPLVLRAFGPLDSIIQAAGRANREGKLAGKGRVIVFNPAEGGSPRGSYQIAREMTRTFLHDGPPDMDDPASVARYFKKLYPLENLDAKKIQKLRKEFDYPAVARAMCMIDSDTVNVVVRYPEALVDIYSLIEQLRANPARRRTLLRQLQPYMVSLYIHQAQKYQKEGLIAPLLEDDKGTMYVGEWLGEYDESTGLQAADLSPDALVL